MKKSFLFWGLTALLAASCTTVRHTATSIDVDHSLQSSNVAELEISPNKVSYEFRPTNKERRGGRQNVLNCAIAATLKAHGNADVLVQPEYTMRIKNGLFWRTKVKEVHVTGYPAKIKKFSQK